MVQGFAHGLHALRVDRLCDESLHHSVHAVRLGDAGLHDQCCVPMLRSTRWPARSARCSRNNRCVRPLTSGRCEVGLALRAAAPAPVRSLRARVRGDDRCRPTSRDAAGSPFDLRGWREGIGFAALVFLLVCVEVLAWLSSPRINVLEKSAVDLLPVDKVESTLYRVLSSVQ